MGLLEDVAPKKKKLGPIGSFINNVGRGVKVRIDEGIEERKRKNTIYKEEFKKAEEVGLRQRARKEGLATGQGRKQSGALAFFEVPAKYGSKRNSKPFDATTALLGGTYAATPFSKKRKPIKL